MTTPYFSVVIPTYNRSDLVTYAVRSVLRQTFSDLEVVVSDNGSTDDTAAVIGRLRDPRVRYAKTAKHGPIAYSWEFARSQARGDFVMMLSDDDALVPDAVERFVDQARRHTARFLSCKVAEYRDATFPGADRNSLSCPAFTGAVETVPASRFIGSLFSFRTPFEMHPSAFVFAREVADTIAARCGGFFQTNGVEYSAWPMAAAVAEVLVYIDTPLIVLGRTAKSWGSNLTLANPGQDRIKAFLADVEPTYRYAPLSNFVTANMWAEGILTAQKLMPQELGAYEFDEAEYLRMTASQLASRRALGVDVSKDLDELKQYLRQNPALGVAVGPLPQSGAAMRKGLWLRLRALLADSGGRAVRRRMWEAKNARKIRRGDVRSGLAVSGAAVGFHNVLESSDFLARVVTAAPPAA
jgi:glycosyltransferase involved in cell wall biosynthesis